MIKLKDILKEDKEQFPKSTYNHYAQVYNDIGQRGVRHKDLEKLRKTAQEAILTMLKEIKKQYTLR